MNNIKMKKILTLLLTLVIAFSFPGMSLAGTVEFNGEPNRSESSDKVQTMNEIYINPLYEDLVDDSIFNEDQVQSDSNQKQLRKLPKATQEQEYYLAYSWEDLISHLREKAKKRVEKVYVKYFAEDSSFYDNEDRGALLLGAVYAHTGVGDEGDYLRVNSYGIGWNWSFQKYSAAAKDKNLFKGKQYEYTIEFNLRYLENTEQAKAVDEKLAQIEKDLNLKGLSDAEKIEKIYAYMTDNIKYDFENLEDDSYMLKYSAYAAVVQNCAVCNAYAGVLYRMLLDAGIDSRVIISYQLNHGWNVAKLGNVYYYMDSTWDAKNDASRSYRTYYLKGKSDFKRHDCTDSDYANIIFQIEQPLANAAYNAKNPETTDILDNVVTYERCGDNVAYILKNNGKLRVLGEGEMYDLGTDHPATGLELYYDDINSITFDEGVTYIGKNFFLGADNVSEITLPSTVTAIGNNAFSKANGDYSITIKAAKANKNAKDFANQNSLQFEALDGCSVHNYGNAVSIYGDNCSFCGLKTCKDCGSNIVTDHTWNLEHDENCHTGQCTVCGRKADKEPHHYTQKVTQKATCTSKGSKTYTCKDCGYSKVEDIPALGHDFSGEWKMDDEQHWKICLHEDCDTIENLGDHVFSQWKILISPTCTKDGQKERSCQTCGYVEYGVADKLGHDFSGEWVVDDEAHWKDCQHDDCYEISAWAKHEFGPWVETKAPTCILQGEQKRACKWCGYEQTQTVNPLGHNLEHHEAKSPTCIDIGWYDYDTCTRCDYTTYDEIGPLGHDFIRHQRKEATCLEAGWNEYNTCSRCDYSSFRLIPALGHELLWNADNEKHWKICVHSGCEERFEEGDHEFGEWIITKKPTCTKAGEKTRTCECNCIVQTVSIEATGHKIVKVKAKSATYLAEGYKAHYECKNCGQCYSDSKGKKKVTRKSITVAKKKPLTQKITTKKISSYKVKDLKKKAKTIKLGAKASGKLTYKVTKGAATNITVSEKGTVTLLKGCKKGTYKVTIYAAATTNGKYKKSSKTVSIKVK